ncbi:MAG: sigma-70 family RNA polymerase sigma factor [Clostridiales bacterium]|jgi:RNA polymerase sporulation-specific sigma factor|nr:sigma-70 family RNA polymerase sigma factor [Clostridiales bacterium]
MFIYDNVLDNSLLLKSRSGDTVAFDCLLNRYKALVTVKARKYFLIGADLDDLVQEGMLGLFKAYREFDPSNGPSFFAFTNLCITRQIFSAIKAANRNKHLPLNLSLSLDVSPHYDDADALINELQAEYTRNPEAMFIDKEEKRKMEAEISKSLSALEKRVLELYLYGYSYAQIALSVNKDEKGVGNALQRIRKKVGNIVS